MFFYGYFFMLDLCNSNTTLCFNTRSVIIEMLPLEDFKVLCLGWKFHLRIWDIEKLVLLKELELPNTGLCLEKIGNYIFCGLDGDFLIIVDIASFKQINKVKCHKDKTSDILCIDENLGLIVTCSSLDWFTRLWLFKEENLEFVQEEQDPSHPRVLLIINYDFGQNNNFYFAIGALDDGNVTIYSIDKISLKMTLFQKFAACEGPFMIRLNNPYFKNEVLVASNNTNELCFWDLKTFQLIKKLQIPSFESIKNSAHFMIEIEDSKTLFIGDQRGTLLAYSLEDFSLLYKLGIHKNSITGIFKSK